MLQTDTTRTALLYSLVTCVLACTRLGFADTTAVTFESVRDMASGLARQPYAPGPADLPQSLLAMDYDAYRAIKYEPNKAIWEDQGLRFGLEFFHRGYLYRDRVDVQLVENGRTVPVEFRPDLFEYPPQGPQDVKSGLGFAGLRIWWASGKDRPEIVSFLGSSYFRAVPPGGAYGASARGIAVDTAVQGQAEEFPAFRRFWVVRPDRDADVLTMYALLDGPSVTGAYQFEIR